MISKFESRGVELVVNLSEKVTPRVFVNHLTPILQDMLHNSEIKAENISEHFKYRNVRGCVYYGIGTDKLRPLFIVSADKTRKSDEFLLENYMMPSKDYDKLVADLGNAFGN